MTIMLVRLLSLLVLLAAAHQGWTDQKDGEVTDGVGRRVKVPAAPKRIVSLAPNTTEILFALGLGDKVVGVTNFCDYPPEAKQKTKVGGMVNPSLEAISFLRPDLVLATVAGNRPETVTRLEKLGIPVFVVNPKDLQGVLSSIEQVGQVTGRREAATLLVQRLRERVKQVMRRVAGLKRPRVLYVLWSDPLIVPGKGTFLDDLIQRAGGESISTGASIPYPLFSLEEVVARAPEVIIVSKGHGQDDQTLLRRWRDLPTLPAVKAGRLYTIDGDLLNRPGPRIVDGLEALARILHPREG